jgi:hypothetical protein
VRLFEFSDNPRLVKTIAAADQLKSALESGEITNNWDLDTLLQYFRKFDLVLSPDDLYSMIQTKPLKSVIRNIEGSEVVFRGLPQEKKEPESPPPEQSKEIVNKMAQKAMGK